ncbi:MAG: AsmA-like C-terminal region-containing protein [Chthoniobacterales bacterium]
MGTVPAVKKLGRVVLFVLGGTVVLAAFLLLAVNMYVQSQGTQTRIQHELSQRLGTTLRLKRMSVTPWSGLTLSGITIPQADPKLPEQFLEAETFQLKIHFPSLFEQRLVIKEVSLIRPHVVWLQNSEHEWRLPPLPDQRTSTAPAAPVPQGELASYHAPAANAANPPATENKVTAAPANPADDESFVPEVRRVNLVGGLFRFLDTHGKVVAIFDDVQFHSNFRNGAAVRGSITIGKTSLRDRFFLQHLQGRVAYGPTSLDLSEVTAHAGDGDITGGFIMQPQLADSPFTAQIKFHDIQAERVLTEAGGPAGTISGRLEGYLNAEGKTADANALAGTGEIFLRDGQLRQYSLLDALGQILQIEELRQLKLEQAEVKYHITPGIVMVDQLVLRSPNLHLAAGGTIGFDGKLQLDSQLAVNEQLRKQLFRAIRANFQPGDEPGFAALKFAIGGTVDRPKTDLMDKLVGGDLKDIGSVIGTFFGTKRDRHKKPAGGGAQEANATEPAAGTSPPPSPTP